MDITGKIKLLKNNQTDANGVAIAPLPTELEFGQIAVNYSATNPAIFIKDSNNQIVKFVTEEIIADTLMEILGGSASDLSTLKELLEAFGNSDIATTQASILTRLTGVESGKVDKVSGKGLSTNDFTNTDKAHMTNTANPHNVTKTQVGLGNVVNKEQLGKTETAVSSKALERQGASLIPTIVGTQVVYNAEVNKSTTGLFPAENNGNAILSFGMHGSSYFQQLGLSSDGNLYRRFFYAKPIDNKQPWLTMYDSGNCNNNTTNWIANKLTAKGGLFSDASASPVTIERTDSDVNVGLIFKGKTINKSLGTTNGELRFGDTADLAAVGKTVWHAGNSNNGDANWRANKLYAHGGNGWAAMITTSGTTNQALFGYTDSVLGDIRAFVRVGDDVLKFNPLSGSGREYDIYHSGNSNKSNVDWRANNLYLTGSVYNTVDTTQWLYHIKRSDNSQVRGVASDGWDLQFHTNNANRLTITSGGNVGINNPNPTAKLHVNGNGLFNLTDTTLTINELGALSGTNVFQLGNRDNKFGLYFGLLGTGSQWIQAGRNDTAKTAYNLLLQPKGGKVGIGLGDSHIPEELLDVNGNGKFSGNVVAKGDVVAYSATSNVYIDPVTGGASNLFDLSDVELPTSLTDNYVLAFDIKKNKWTAKESVGTGGTPVDYSRLANVPKAFTPTAHNHEDATYVSDARLKQNISPLNNALSTILSLQGMSFGWTSEARNRYNMKDDVSYGYIAQEVQKVIPHVVKELETGDGYIGVEYIKLIPYLSEAIRELHQANIETNVKLKKEVTKSNREYNNIVSENKELKLKITDLEQRLINLESKLN